MVLKWQGSQPELMGLDPDVSHLAGIKALAQWEASGGKLYVTSDIRKRMKRALAVHPRISNLKQKMTEITSLRHRISKKVAQGTRIRLQFDKEMGTIAEEIKDEMRRMGARSREEATQCPRTDYDLRLLQQYNGYLFEINQRLAHLQSVDVHLAYLLQQAEDDMKIIETLDSTHPRITLGLIGTSVSAPFRNERFL
jgi:hypothetical protein